MDYLRDKGIETEKRGALFMTKKIVILLIIIIATFLIIGIVFSLENKPVQVKKQPEIQLIKPKKPVRIKVKRSADGKYTWELTGEDVDEIARADKRLKKLLQTQ
jgi:Golgi nucleoside diphosphatase